MQRATLVLEQTLHEPGELMDHVYFVEDGIVSITADTGDSGSVEIGLIGIEGVVGVSPHSTRMPPLFIAPSSRLRALRPGCGRPPPVKPWRHRVHAGTAAFVSLNIRWCKPLRPPPATRATSSRHGWPAGC